MKSGDDDTTTTQRNALTQAVGECIFAWSEVEIAMSGLYVVAIGGDTFPQIFVFDSILGLDARVDAIKAALHYNTGSIDSDQRNVLLKDWKSLDAAIRRRYKLRHEIAHASIIKRTNKARGQEMVIFPFPTISRMIRDLFGKTEKEQVHALTLHDVTERCESFLELRARIDRFSSDLRDARGQPPKST